jgi:hypothetical protein
MKLIILDHFRRWWFVLTAILIAYFAFQAIAIHKDNSQTSDDQTINSVNLIINTVHNLFIFQAVMWLGFLLVWDIQRGLPRVLISMPMTAKQIGRALWLATVALPAIALGIVGFLAFLFFHHETSMTSLLKDYLMNWILVALYLGAMFGAQTFMRTILPDTFADRIRGIPFNLFFALPIIGWFLLQMKSLSLSQMILIYAGYIILSILGWFRAERMILQRASFRNTGQTSNKKPTQHKIPQGFGGLPYLMQNTFIQTTLIGLAIVGCMTLTMSFFHFSNSLNRAQMITSMVNGGSTSYIFVFIISITPMVFQLRFLRTLPIAPSTLAATLVFLPVASIAAMGLIVTVLATFVAGESVIPHTVNSFLMLGAKVAIMASVIVWRGLDAVTYFLIFLMVVSDSFITLGLTLIFHLGSKTPEHPLWISLTIFLICVVVSFALTCRLLNKSSSAYRVRTMPGNAWSMARR